MPVTRFDFWFNLNTISKLLKVTVKGRWDRELPSVRCKDPVVQLELKIEREIFVRTTRKGNPGLYLWRTVLRIIQIEAVEAESLPNNTETFNRMAFLF